MKVYINYDITTGVVQGWGSSPASVNDMLVDIEEDHPLITQPFMFKIVNGDYVEDISVILQDAKLEKDMELNIACNLSILAGFEHEVKGETYWFSYDEQAQGNFRDARDILHDGILTAVPWTVKRGGEAGEYDRVDIDLKAMGELTVKIMTHKLSKIARYRDVLMPLVNNATTVEEVKSIRW